MNILVTDPTVSILQALERQLVKNQAFRLFSSYPIGAGAGSASSLMELTYDNGSYQRRSCGCVAVDEVWYTKNPEHSATENCRNTRAVLSFMQENKTTLIHYISSIFVTEEGSVVDGEQEGGMEIPLQGAEEECHCWNEKAIAASGVPFRIYRIPLLADSRPKNANGWLQFVSYASEFKRWIEARIPQYCLFHPVRLKLSKRGLVYLSLTRTVAEIMSAHATRATPGSTCCYILGSWPAPLSSYFPAIAEQVGIHLLDISGDEELNPIDRLFCLGAEQFVPYLNCENVVAGEKGGGLFQVAQESRAECLAPGVAVRSGLAACDEEKENYSREVQGAWLSFENRQTATPDGEVSHYCIGGKGRTALVLLNAYGQGFGYWTNLIGDLARQFRIVLWLPRGNQFDTVGLNRFSPQEAHAEDMHRLLVKEGITSANILAWCTGPKLALEYYSRYPQTVSSMVFLSGSFKSLPGFAHLETSFERDMEPLLRMVQQQPQLAGLLLEALKGILLGQATRLSSQTQEAINDRDFQTLLCSVSLSLRELVLEPFTTRQAVLAYAEQLNEFWGKSVVSLLGKIAVPMLFISGDCDRVAAPAISKVVAEMIPQAKYLEIRGGSHYLQHEQHELLAQIIRRFVHYGPNFSYRHPWVTLHGGTRELATHN